MSRAYTTTGIELRNTSGSATIDSSGVVSIVNFTQSATTGSALNQVITGTSDITDSSYSYVLARPALVFHPFSTHMYLQQSGTNTGQGEVYLNHNGVSYANTTTTCRLHSEITGLVSTSCYILGQEEAGTHTWKLTGRVMNMNGTISMTVQSYQSSYIILGN